MSTRQGFFVVTNSELTQLEECSSKLSEEMVTSSEEPILILPEETCHEKEGSQEVAAVLEGIVSKLDKNSTEFEGTKEETSHKSDDISTLLDEILSKLEGTTDKSREVSTPHIKIKRKYRRRTTNGPIAKKIKMDIAEEEPENQEAKVEVPYFTIPNANYQDTMTITSTFMYQCGLHFVFWRNQYGLNDVSIPHYYKRNDFANYVGDKLQNFNEKTLKILQDESSISEKIIAKPSEVPSIIKPFAVSPLPNPPLKIEFPKLLRIENSNLLPSLLPLSQLLSGPNPRTPCFSSPVLTPFTDSSGYETAVSP